MEEFGPDYELEELDPITPENRQFQIVTYPSHRDHYRRNGFEDFTADLLLSHSKEGMLFIDVGAHHGFYSLLVGTKFKKAEVIAFEPVPENCEVLKRNLRINGLDNVRIYNLALSSNNQRRNFHVTAHSSHGSFYEHHLSESIKMIEVESVSLDNFLGHTPSIPTIIKIDTEGHEIHVLDGMKSILLKAPDIKLFVEFNPYALRSAGFQPEHLLEKIQQLDFDIYLIDDESSQTYKLPPTGIKNWNRYFSEGNYRKDYFNIFCAKKDRVLSVCFFSHSSQLGGAERSLLELTTELIRDHSSVSTVVLPGDGPLKRKLKEAGASTTTFDHGWWCDPNPAVGDDIKSRSLDSMKALVRHIQPQLAKINPDIVLTNTMVIPWGAIAASLLQKPHVWFIREFGQLDHGLKFYLPFQTMLRIIRDSSNLILTNSEAVRRVLFGNADDETILTVYTHIDVPDALGQQGGDNCFRKRDATKLLISGQVTESKGQEDAVLAVKELVRRNKNVELIVMGNGSPWYIESLKTIVQDENLSAYVSFLGFSDNPYRVVNQADIVLVCSKNEAFGRTTLEAMLLKKPVIGTNTGGTVELIREGFNGLLYQPGDYKQLADNVQWLMENEESCREFGENGYNFAKENFSKDKYGGRIAKLLGSLKHSANPSLSAYGQYLMKLVVELVEAHKKDTGDRDARIGHLSAQLADLEAGVSARDARIGDLEACVSARDASIGVVGRALGESEAYIQHLHSGHGWRLLTKYFKIRDRLFPKGTKRRQLAKNIFHRICSAADVLGRMRKTIIRKLAYLSNFRSIEWKKRFMINPLAHWENRTRGTVQCYRRASNCVLAQSPLNRWSKRMGVLTQFRTPPPTILIVTHVRFYPPTAGNELRIFRLIKFLKNRGYQIAVMVNPLTENVPLDSERRRKIHEFVDYYEEVGDFDGDHIFSTGYGQPIRTEPTLEERRQQEQTFCPDAVLWRTSELIKRFSPRVIIAEYIWTSRVLKLAPAGTLRVIDLIDMFSNKAKNVNHFGFDDALAISPQEEKAFLNRADLAIAIQDIEAAAFREMEPTCRVITAGVDFDVAALSDFSEQPVTPAVVLIVASNNPFNARCVQEFIEQSWPIIRKLVPQCILRIVGKVCGSLVSRDQGLELIPYAADLTQVYRQASVVVNPVYAGTGLKVKSVEALGHGQALVSWRQGVAGIPSCTDTPYIVSNSWVDMATQVVQILTNANFSRGLRAKAYEFAETNLSVEVVYRELVDQLESICPPKPKNIICLYIRYGADDYADSLGVLQDWYSKNLAGFAVTIWIIDNKIQEDFAGTDLSGHRLLSGDNSCWEFSGWQKVIAHYRSELQDYDVVHFVTSAFTMLYTGYLDHFSPAQLNLVTRRPVCLGHIDHYDQPVLIKGKCSQHWIRTCFFFMSPTSLFKVNDLVSFGKADDILDSAGTFRVDAPLSANYKQYIAQWLAGQEMQGVVWHGRIENVDMYKAKILAILNEHMLSLRLRQEGVSLVDFYWLNQPRKEVMSTADLSIPPCEYQIRLRQSASYK